MTFGFIIPSYINDSKSLKILLNGLNKIRNFYPNNKIVIIDDYSVLNIKKIIDELNDSNISVEKAQYNKAGEMNPYYHFYLNKYFDVAMIIQDSFHFNKTIGDFSNVNIQFLSHFNNHFDWDKTKAPINEYNTSNQIFSHSDEILHFVKIALPENRFKNKFQAIYNKKYKWVGCLGCMSIVSHEFITSLQMETQIFDMLPFIKTRRDRMCMESIYAIACFYIRKKFAEKKPISVTNFNADYTYNSKFSLYFSDLFTKYSLAREQ
jgi:hypothetical protein